MKRRERERERESKSERGDVTMSISCHTFFLGFLKTAVVTGVVLPADKRYSREVFVDLFPLIL